MLVMALHDKTKPGSSKAASEFIHNGKDVFRKMEIEKEIAARKGEKCLKVGAKNSVVYAAVEVTDEEGNRTVEARIFDTSVSTRYYGAPKEISWVEYKETEYMGDIEFERIKQQLSSAGVGSEDYKKIKDTLNADPRYLLPTDCPSAIIKLLSPTTNPNAKKWRRACKDQLADLAAEKLCVDSLTNLPLDSRIMLANSNPLDDPVYLTKDTSGKFKYPVWTDEKSGRKYKIKEIQQIGYEIVERGI